MTRPAGGFQLSLDTGQSHDLPVFLRIARAIAADARTGRLLPGSRLPGSRELATSLGVHRNTVLAAYRELSAEGFLVSAAGSGTFIADTLPEVHPKRWLAKGASAKRAAMPVRAPFPFEPTHTPSPYQEPPRGAALLYGGMADMRLLPRDAIARAYRRAVRKHRDIFSYGDPRGEPSLREALAQMLRTTRGLLVSADDLLITRGSQMAISLIGRLLARKDDVIAVEARGYKPAWRALTQHGARLAAVPIDDAGLVTTALAELCERASVRAVYVTPHHQYPSTVTMSAARRMHLLELARKHHFAIIEDDFDHEFHYDGRPVLPLASADETGHVLYAGTLSKVLAPGVRVGYLIAPTAIREAATALRFDIDRQGDRVTEHALAELLEDGELQRHLWRTRRIYHARRDHAVAQLRDVLGEHLEFRVPQGGMALWVRVAKHLPIARFHEEAAARNVFFQPGKLFTLEERDIQYARIGFGALTEREFANAIGKLRDAARAAMGKKR